MQDPYEAERRIRQVIWQMKEIPELPSEAPKDVQNLEKVEFPTSGGVLTYMGSNEYPYRGFPFFEFVDKIDLIKKLSRGMLSGLFHEVKVVNKLLLITLLPALWFSKIIVHAAIYAFHRLVVRSRIKTIMYSEAIQELYRAFDYDDYSEDGKTRQLRVQLRDILCMILEFDNAYRFRFQDMIEELDKGNLKKNPIRELERLLTSMQSRENGQDIKDTWYLLKLFCRFYLRLDGRMRNILVGVFSRIDIEKSKLYPEDKYFCTHRKDFAPRFLKGLREIPIEKLTDEQKKDRLIIEKAHIQKNLSEEKVGLVDRFNTERAIFAEPFEAEKKRLIGELDAIKEYLKKFEGELNAEATKQSALIERIVERFKGTDVPNAATQLNGFLKEDVAALQARFNEEAEKKNKESQVLINTLAELEAKFTQDSTELEKKYNILLEENRIAYPKKVAELKL